MKRFGALYKAGPHEAHEFEVDAEMVEPSRGTGSRDLFRLPVRAYVDVSARAPVGPPLEEGDAAILVHPILNEAGIAQRAAAAPQAVQVAVDHLLEHEESYWTPLSRLMTSGWTEARSGAAYPWGLYLPRDTREAMLVWMDQHRDEVQEKKQIAFDAGVEAVEHWGLDFHEFAADEGTPQEIAQAWADTSLDEVLGDLRTDDGSIAEIAAEAGLSLKTAQQEFKAGFATAVATEIALEREKNPPPAEVQRRFEAAGISAGEERSGGADWSVRAWRVGQHLYVTDTESEDQQGFAVFDLIYRKMTGEDDDLEPIEQLFEGTLDEVIDVLSRTPHADLRRTGAKRARQARTR